MLFDPEDGKTMEEIIDLAVRKLKPETRARLEQVSQVSGRSVYDLAEECVHLVAESLQDPVSRAAWLARLEGMEHPYGRDPLLKKERP